MKPKPIKKPFEKWYPDELQESFGLQLIPTSDRLVEWTSVEAEIPETFKSFINGIRLELLAHKSYWNEAELIAKFIAPFLLYVQFEGDGFSSFSERKMKAVVGEYEISGTVDWVAAKGVRIPKAPYFFLHEYKRFKMGDADPIGQLLAEMLVAQTINNDGLPIYGCYIAAHIWTFVLLDGKNYASSQGYDATDEQELTKIWSILLETKRRVAERAKGNTEKPIQIK